MMKATVLLVALAVITVNEASVLKNPAARVNLQVGWVQAGDRLLYRGYLQKNPIVNSVQTQDLIYRGNLTTRINAVLATEMGAYTQYASAWVIAGGVGYNNVTIRVQSARSWGYFYMVDIWGR